MKFEPPLHPGQVPLERLNRLIALFNEGRHSDVEVQAQALVEKYPTSGFAWLILGASLQAQRKDSLFALQQAVNLLPEDAEAHCNLGVALEKGARLDEAVAAYRHALAINPQYVPALCNLGNTLRSMGRLDEAAEHFQATLAIDPLHYKANINLKSIFMQQHRLIDAKNLCVSVLNKKSNFHEMRQNLALTLSYLSDYEQVESESNLAIEGNPDQPMMWEQRLYSFSYHPDLSVAEILREFTRWGDRFSDPPTDFASHDRNPRRRLRIGYVSPDFRKHSSRFYFWPLFANHDRNAFELFAYSNVQQEVAWTRIFQGQFEHWRDIRDLSNEQAASLIRDDRIDILVDLCSHMQDHRLGVFALKPAPIQATWLGSAWTTGLKTIDYALLDPYLAPEGTLARESILRLPKTFLAFRPPEQTADLVPAPCLKNGYPTFGYSGRTERLNHRVFRVWGELLRRLPEARLVLDFGPFGEAKTQTYYRGFLAAHGVDIQRVIFRNSPKIYEGLNDIDILLDSFPHSGGTMLMDGFWMGVPAVTLASRPPLGRICASMLMNLGLPDWIAATEAEYIEKACHFASQPLLVNELRLGMRERMKQSPLMDGPDFARQMEAAYRGMFDRWLQGTDPSGDEVPQASLQPAGGGS